MFTLFSLEMFRAAGFAELPLNQWMTSAAPNLTRAVETWTVSEPDTFLPIEGLTSHALWS
jgi:hypothetical protein